MVIKGKALLSQCSIESICDYIALPNASSNIENNLPGCNSPQEINCQINGTNNISKPQQPHSITIYPNPSQQYILADLKDAIVTRLSVTDLSGRIVLSKDTHEISKQTIRIPTQNLKPGIYILRGYDQKSGTQLRQKFVKQ